APIPPRGGGALSTNGIATRCLVSGSRARPTELAGGAVPAPPPVGSKFQRGPPPKSGAFGAPRLRLRSHRGAVGPCRPTASLRDAWSPARARGPLSWLAGLFQPRPPLEGNSNGAPHSSPEPSALRAYGSEPTAERWGPVDPRHCYAMPGLRLARAAH